MNIVNTSRVIVQFMLNQNVQNQAMRSSLRQRGGENDEDMDMEFYQTAGCPTIISRSQWGAQPPTSTVPLSTPVPYVIIYHTAGSSCTSQASCSQVVRGIQNYHMDSNGWTDIAYNFLIGEDGNVYEGRGWSTVGAHASGWNDRSLGLAFLGTFSSMWVPSVRISLLGPEGSWEFPPTAAHPC
ncbi:peptidoglycan-recognition protein SC2-like [Emys orbicularis]|uniref:peptidoglycan-recognition protein SC2-like n=1 Tax=Emys orbicularis TaxID=82168 RepID=UPI0031FCBA42